MSSKALEVVRNFLVQRFGPEIHANRFLFFFNYVIFFMRNYHIKTDFFIKFEVYNAMNKPTIGVFFATGAFLSLKINVIKSILHAWIYVFSN